MYCRFEYTERYKKVSKVLDFVYYAYAALLVLIVINNFFIKIVNPELATNVLLWASAVLFLIDGVIKLYEVRSVSLPSLGLTMKYDEINHDNPLQKAAVARAIECAEYWAEFALKREKNIIKSIGIYKIAFAILFIICLIF